MRKERDPWGVRKQKGGSFFLLNKDAVLVVWPSPAKKKRQGVIGKKLKRGGKLGLAEKRHKVRAPLGQKGLKSGKRLVEGGHTQGRAIS